MTVKESRFSMLEQHSGTFSVYLMLMLQVKQYFIHNGNPTFTEVKNVQ